MTSKTSRTRLSPNFAAAEFDCRNGEKWPPAARDALVLLCTAVLEPLREEFGPVVVTSGYRPLAYNRTVGGATSSYHRYELRYGTGRRSSAGVGVAADVVPARGTPQQWASYLESIRRGMPAIMSGRGAFVPYPRSGFVHCDTGPRRTWAG